MAESIGSHSAPCKCEMTLTAYARMHEIRTSTASVGSNFWNLDNPITSELQPSNPMSYYSWLFRFQSQQQPYRCHGHSNGGRLRRRHNSCKQMCRYLDVLVCEIARIRSWSGREPQAPVAHAPKPKPKALPKQLSMTTFCGRRPKMVQRHSPCIVLLVTDGTVLAVHLRAAPTVPLPWLPGRRGGGG